ncbi:MAG: FAD:protein FMN transferase [Gallionellaceae bacterium]|jgi:thiamine biosynthesis lipoprotein
MGTQCEMQLYAQNENQALAAAQSAIDEVRRIEARYSRYRADSVLSAINQSSENGKQLQLDDETANLLDYALICYEKSGGLFDITSGVLRSVWNFSSRQLPTQNQIDAILPLIGMNKIRWERPNFLFELRGMEIDFGGIAKEYAADQAAAVCLSAGIEHGLIELGGDIKVIGPHPDNSPWLVGIRHPRQADQPLLTLEIFAGAVATSGDYERFMLVNGVRYSHLLNPFTGCPVQGLQCASIITEQCLVAGSIATIGLLKGADGKPWLNDSGVRHLWVDEAGKLSGNVFPINNN